MMEILAGGVVGLLFGIAVQRCGLTDRSEVSAAIALRRRSLTRRVLMLLGWGCVLTALLGWLAVIDVDTLIVIPLHGGTIVGGVIFGAAAALTGLLPGTAPAIMGGGRFLEGLCGAAGCLCGAFLLPNLTPVFRQVRTLIPDVTSTLFQVTLDEPYLFGGGFLAQGCLGAVLMALALIISPDPPAPVPETAPPAPEPEPQPVSTEPEDVMEDTVIALLPGEEPVVVDTAAPEDAQPQETKPEAPEEPESAEPEAASQPAGEDGPEEIEAQEAEPEGPSETSETEKNSDDVPEEDKLG